MDNLSDERIAAMVLFSLARKGKWGESHTAIENIFKIFKSQALGREGLRRARGIADSLFRKGFIRKKPTNYGLQVSLNPNMAREIKAAIREQLGFDI